MLKHKILITLAVLFLFLIPVSSALAYFATINTNDGLVDSNWPATPLITDASGDATSRYGYSVGLDGDRCFNPHKYLPAGKP